MAAYLYYYQLLHGFFSISFSPSLFFSPSQNLDLAERNETDGMNW